MGDQKSTLTAQVQGSTLTGTMAGPSGHSEIKDGKMENNRLSWLARISTPMALTLEFSGAVAGDSLSGSVKLGAFASAPFTGERE